MARYQRTEGICLRRIDFSNTSQVACFLTPDCGQLAVLAKGVTRAPKGGIRTGFDLLGRYELIYSRRQPGSLQNLTYRWLVEEFRGLRQSLELAFAGYYAAELALNFTAEGDPCPGFYAALLRALRELSAGKDVQQNILRLELEALREHGSSPRLDACAECGGALPARGAVCFSPAAGGALCTRCDRQLDGPARARCTSTGAALLAKMAQLASLPAAAPLPPDLSPHEASSASAVLRFFIRDLLGKELKMWKHLPTARRRRA